MRLCVHMDAWMSYIDLGHEHKWKTKCHFRRVVQGHVGGTPAEGTLAPSTQGVVVTAGLGRCLGRVCRPRRGHVRRCTAALRRLVCEINKSMVWHELRNYGASCPCRVDAVARGYYIVLQ